MTPSMETSEREPVLNVPAPLVAIVLVLLGIHLLMAFGPSPWTREVLVAGAFIPARLTLDGGGWAAWSMWVSYAFLHGGWAHLALNSLWLVIFGTPVLQRIGTMRFALLCLAGAIGAAGLHVVAHWGDVVPMIGASGVVSALTGAAARFAFAPGARRDPRRARRQALSQTFTNTTTLSFVAVWLVANVLFGAGMLDPNGPSIAWEAHIGGFLVGLLGFALFDQSGTRSVAPSEPTER